MKSFNSSGKQNSRKILLVGDINKAFLDVGNITEKQYELCVNMLDAIDTAANNDFAGIGVVMAGMSARLSSALRALRDNSDAKIILLAQMYEEPIAIHLVGSAGNDTDAADDYIICPVRTDRFYKSIMIGQINTSVQPGLSVPLDEEIEKKIKLLEKMATEDDLTGLKNRRYIWEFCRQIIERASKENGRVTLLVFDIDNFKHYNDAYGHSVGDEVLKQAAVLMQRCCRSHDVVGRIGGAEFAVVFWDQANKKETAVSDERRSAIADHPTEAIFIAKRFIRELEKSELTPLAGLGLAGKGVLTISGGLASYPRDGSTIQEVFQQADQALLDAKRSGKNRIYLVGRSQSNIADLD
jgi:diguanylate cyclase (GGDEF)-like protein